MQNAFLLTMIIKKEHTESIFPSTPLFSGKYCRDMNYVLKKERGEEKNISVLTKAGSHPCRGMDSR